MRLFPPMNVAETPAIRSLPHTLKTRALAVLMAGALSAGGMAPALAAGGNDAEPTDETEAMAPSTGQDDQISASRPAPPEAAGEPADPALPEDGKVPEATSGKTSGQTPEEDAESAAPTTRPTDAEPQADKPEP